MNTESISPRFGPDGLVPAVAQDAGDGAVLMLAWMNEEAWQQTVRTGLATFYSRTRGRLWQKGETSGNVLRVQEIRLDCDHDAVLLLVDAAGPACHTGARACFYERV
ncbi:MAG TPA: phosphoribosyl-AMP cyclohydrolase [Candidatus Sulfotelmatobacter sp.]|nr:phosphoribosyl-AMP cyclohydrolase [Candidatus Sulfotelmatobacter sp.]